MIMYREKHEIKLPRNNMHRNDKGNVWLTGRDWRSMLWIAEQYAVRLDQVQYLLSQEAGKGAKEPGRIGINATRLVVARWQRAGLAESKKILAFAPSWIWLTAKGLNELGLPFKPYSPSLPDWNTSTPLITYGSNSNGSTQSMFGTVNVRSGQTWYIRKGPHFLIYPTACLKWGRVILQQLKWN